MGEPDDRVAAKPDDLLGCGAESRGAGMRLGISGCGRVVEHGYLPAAARAGDIELVGVADPNEGRRERAVGIATRLGLGRPRPYASDAALLEGDHVDALVVANPPVEHLESATRAAGRGVAVLVEKPPAPSLEEARGLAKLGGEIRIGFNRRYAAGELVDSIPREGSLRVDLELRYRRSSWSPYTVRDGVLLDLLPHLVDLGVFIGSSPPIAVRALALEHDRANVEMQTTRAVVRMRCAADRPHRESIEVRDGLGRRLVAANWGGISGHLRRVSRRPHPLVETMTQQLRDLAAAVRGEAAPRLATAGDGVRAMIVIEAALRSSERGGVPVGLAGAALAAGAPTVGGATSQSPAQAAATAPPQ